MSRIKNAYTSKFRTALAGLRARRVEDGVNWCLSRAEAMVQVERITPAHALGRVHGRLLRGLRLLGRGRGTAGAGTGKEPVFLCDAGLGGLARWLRASGYEADWISDIDDDDLLREGARRGSLILTTDSMLMERRILRDGVLPALWVPPTLKMREQLALIFAELALEPRESRCMSCGGRLREVKKESIRERIPPKTYVWRDEFFECERCGKIFWHGTHWEKITRHLYRLAGDADEAEICGGDTCRK